MNGSAADKEAFGNLYYCKKGEYGLKILTRLIEQSVEAQTTLIEHSNPHLETPFEQFWICPCLHATLYNVFWEIQVIREL